MVVNTTCLYTGCAALYKIEKSCTLYATHIAEYAVEETCRRYILHISFIDIEQDAQSSAIYIAGNSTPEVQRKIARGADICSTLRAEARYNAETNGDCHIFC